MIMSKWRLAPRRELTLPRLELTAAMIGARMGDYIRKQIQVPVKDLHFWTDAMVALHWLKGDGKRWRAYVGNRVSEIQKLSAQPMASLPRNGKSG